MTIEQYNYLVNKGRELMNKTMDPVHDTAHIERVLVNAEKIMKLLSKKRKEEIDEKILKLAIMWHDISYIKYKPTLRQYFLEGKRSSEIIWENFKLVKLPASETSLIADIVWHHTWNDIGILNYGKGLYHKIVQDADHLDSFSEIRLKQAEETAEMTVFKKVVMKVLKPIFWGYILRHKKFFLNLNESLEIE